MLELVKAKSFEKKDLLTADGPISRFSLGFDSIWHRRQASRLTPNGADAPTALGDYVSAARGSFVAVNNDNAALTSNGLGRRRLTPAMTPSSALAHPCSRRHLAITASYGSVQLVPERVEKFLTGFQDGPRRRPGSAKDRRVDRRRWPKGQMTGGRRYVATLRLRSCTRRRPAVPKIVVIEEANDVDSIVRTPLRR